MRFETTVIQLGNNTGIEVPPSVLEALGGGRRPAVLVTVGGYSFASTVGARDSRALIPFSAERRRETGIGGGDVVEVDLELDTSVRTVPVPADLASALDEAGAAGAFAALAPSARKAHVVSIEGAKTEATRARRVESIVRRLATAEVAIDGIEIVRDVAAEPSDVFAAWTTAEHFARWFGGRDVSVPEASLRYEPVEGAAWEATMVLPDGHTIRWAGEFVEVSPPTRFVWTMTDDPSSPDRATVTIDLAAFAGGTRLRFAQETPGFSPEQREATTAGWQSFLDELVAGLPEAHQA